MNLKGIINVLIERYEANNGKKSLPAPYVVPLLAEPTDEQLEQLKEGDGNPIAEMCQINSSAGLAFNYYKLFESFGNITALRFEWKESTPLKIPGRKNPPANLDVRYEKENEIHFVESKYLEPYYSGNEQISLSYLNQDNYSTIISNASVWVSKFRDLNKYKYVNATQLYRHLLAIYRHYLENPHIYKGKNIVFESVSWKATDHFLDYVGRRSKSFLKERISVIENETIDVENDINEFIKLLKWENCSFKVKHYNDMLDDIRNAEKFDDFCKQYFLE